MQEYTFSHRGSPVDSLYTDGNLEWNKWRRRGGVAVEEKEKESLNAQVRAEIYVRMWRLYGWHVYMYTVTRYRISPGVYYKVY